ncbi:FAD-dependent oxidoreductase [Streptomyces sp. NPDC004237]|uniref:NAD(P)/FAD-dependent oxidoreductase n=1 Tax=Streptomyces sp. NPDC004237 TaxID=3154455 RepID=UPI0033B8C9EF
MTAVDSRSVVVVGAGLGGLTVAEELRRLGFGGSVVLVGAEHEAPYDRPPLSKEVLKGTRSNPPSLREPDELDALGLDLRLGTVACGVDTAARRVRLRGGGELPYDVLVVATGARARGWDAAGGASNVWSLRTAQDAARIGAAVARGGSIGVLGAGFIGCEVAASAREAGCEVTLVEVQSAPLAHALGPEAGAEIARRHRAAGVDVRCGVTIVDADLAGDVLTGVRLSDGTGVTLDGLVVGLGVVPDTGWLEGSGIAVDNGVVCDASGRTSQEGVYAVGDVARWVNARTGRHRRIEHWTTTIEQAAIVASDITGQERRVLDEVPYFWSDQYGTKIQCVGEPDAGADITVRMTGADGDRPLYLYSQAGALTGVLGFGLARVVMRLRALVAERAALGDALDLVDELYPRASALTNSPT